MTSLAGSILTIAIPAISQDLGATWEITQWIPIGFLLVMAITLIAFGKLSDLKGKKKIFILGLIIFTLGSLLSGLAWDAIILVIFYAITGIGSSLLTATSIAMVTEVFPREETGKALGINVAGIYVGLVLGPSLGGILVQFMTWRSVFLVNVPIGIILIIFSLLKLKKSDINIKDEKFDVLGTIFFGIFLASLLVALTLGNQLGWSSFFIILLILMSITSFFVFIFIEKNAQFPMLNLSLFRHNRVFSTANTAALLSYIATSGFFFLSSIYLQTVLGIAPAIAGLLMLPITGMMAIFSPLSGKYSDKIGTKLLTTVGMIILAAGIGLFVLILIFLPIWYIIISQTIIGIGYGLFSSPNQSAIMNSVEKHQYGIASGTLSTMRVTGQSSSIAILSSVLTIFILPSVLNSIISKQSVSITPEIQTQFLLGFIVSLILSMIFALFAALLSFVRGKENQRIVRSQ